MLLRVEQVFLADVVNVTFRLFNQHIKPLAQIGCDHVHQTEFGDHFVPVHIHRLKKEWPLLNKMSALVANLVGKGRTVFKSYRKDMAALVIIQTDFGEIREADFNYKTFSSIALPMTIL